MKLPRLLVIGTGGTIAGTAPRADQAQRYTPGVLGVDQLLAAVPALGELAQIETASPYAIGSQHLTHAHLDQLIARVRAAQADPGVRGVVITHGTDTLEETALALDLACPRRVPVVLTGAMRPANALGAEGPVNLHAAAVTALDPAAQGAGVMVAFNDQIFDPVRVTKAHTSRTDAFVARHGAPLAEILNGRPRWQTDPVAQAARRPSLAHALAGASSPWPQVALMATAIDADPGMVDFLVSRGARALVVAGTGHGTLADPMRDALAAVAAQGVVVVRASRVAQGPVLRDSGVEDSRYGFVAAGMLSPHKARMVIACGLAAGLDREALQALIDQY